MCLPCKEAGHGHDIPGVGIFSNHAFYSFQGSELPDGLYPNTDRVGGAHFERIYESDLVSVSDGYLNLLVPGGQVSGPIRGSGVNTKANNILYASVRTQAAFSHVPGTIQSSFFYKTDNAEIDIEYVSDPSSTSNHGGVPSLHYTNHGATVTTAQGINPGNEFREYRYDWIPGFTRFYVDGVLQKEFTENVPAVGGTCIWNHWSNGNKDFSVGPPKEDAIMRVRSIEMFYNTTEEYMR